MICDETLLDPSPRTAVGLPRIFPRMGPATFEALFGDVARDAADVPVAAWEFEAEVIETNHLAGLAINRLVGEPVPMPVRESLRAAALMDMNLSDLAVHCSVPSLQRLEELGFPYVVIKGPGIAALEGGSFARPFSDLDLLIREADFAQALRTLRQDGFEERTASQPTWGYFNRFCREAVNLRSDTGGSIDLHHRVSPWLWSGSLDFARLAGRSQKIPCAGSDLPVASPVHNLLVCALHIVSDHGQPGVSLRPWRDVVVLAGRCDPDEVASEAEAAQLTGWLKWILDSLPESVRPLALCERLEDASSSIRARRRLANLLPPHVGSSHLIGQALRLPVGHALMFLAGMVVPSPQFLRQHYPDGGHYLRWWRDSTSGLRAACQG
jgi:hypothetical protein